MLCTHHISYVYFKIKSVPKGKQLNLMNFKHELSQWYLIKIFS